MVKYSIQRKKTHKIVLSILHAVWMLIFTWFWINFGPTLEDEKALIRISTITKRLILNVDEDRPKRHQLMFVNIANDLDLIQSTNGNGKQPITNRVALAQFLGFLKQHPEYYKYIICDVVFDQPDMSENGNQKDALLRKAFQGLPRTVCAAQTDRNGQIIKGIFPSKQAVVEFRAKKGGSFMKFKLHQGDNKSLPLVMYEDIHHKKMKYHGLGYATTDGIPSFNKMIIDFRLRQNHIVDTSFYGGAYTLQSLGELIDITAFDTSVFNFMKEHRPIVVIGDFTRIDLHTTIVGETGGPLILLNVYLGLLYGNQIIPLFLPILLIVAYFIISYLTFYDLPFKTSHAWRRFSYTLLGKLIIEYLSIALFLITLTILCYVFFHIHLNILIMGIYVKVLHWWRMWREKRTERSISSKKNMIQVGPQPDEFDQQDTSMYTTGTSGYHLIRQLQDELIPKPSKKFTAWRKKVFGWLKSIKSKIKTHRN